MRPRHFRRDGTPYPEGDAGLREWATDLENPALQIVRQDELENGYVVSTVWIGLDHQYGDGPPLIFETMVFFNSEDEDTRRYSTEQEAIEGHARLVTQYRARRPQPIDEG